MRGAGERFPLLKPGVGPARSVHTYFRERVVKLRPRASLGPPCFAGEAGLCCRWEPGWKV